MFCQGAQAAISVSVPNERRGSTIMGPPVIEGGLLHDVADRAGPLQILGSGESRAIDLDQIFEGDPQLRAHHTAVSASRFQAATQPAAVSAMPRVAGNTKSCSVANAAAS